MSNSHLMFFILISIFLIYSQASNETNSTKEKNEIPKDPEPQEVLHVGKNESNSTKHTHRRTIYRDPKSKLPFNASVDEMDKIIFCALIVQDNLRNIQESVENVTKRLNLSSSNPVYDKVGSEAFEKCYNKIQMKDVNKYMVNLTLIKNYEREDAHNDLVKIDFDSYLSENDLELTMQQRVLMYKFHEINELYRQKLADNREDYEEAPRKIKIGEFDMDSIPKPVKFGLFLVILVVFFGGVFYFLKKMEKKPKDKKKKDKKKKKSE